MDWDRLHAFLAVAEHGGFTAAGRVIGRTQSAVSQAIASLEQELEQSLFVRQRRGATLTEAGRILLEHARKAESELQQAKQRLSTLSHLSEGQLRLGTTDTLGCHLLPEALTAFRSRHPGVEVHMRAGTSPEIAMAVAEGDVEVGIVSLPLPGSLRPQGRPLATTVEQQPLLPMTDVVVVNDKHALSRRARVSLAELADHELLVLARGTAGREQLDRAFSSGGLQPRIRMEMNSVELLKRMVTLGFGAAVVPAISVPGAMRPPRSPSEPPAVTADAASSLIAIELTGGQMARSAGLLLPRKPLSQAAHAFAEVAQRKLSRRLP